MKSFLNVGRAHLCIAEFPLSNLILDVTRMDRHSVNGEAVSQTDKAGGTHSNLAFTAEAADID